MVTKALLDIRRQEARIAIVLLLVLVTALIVYKTGGARRAIQTVQSAGQFTPRPYLVHSIVGTQPAVLWTESWAYLRIIWPALVLGILISAAARMAIPHDWFASTSAGPRLRSTFSGAAAGVPLMLCSCCAASVFEGVYGHTRRLDASLAMLLAAPSLNSAALALTFVLFPVSVAAGRVALTMVALIGIAGISTLVSGPKMKIPERHPSLLPQSFLAAYADSVLHVGLRTVPLILIGAPIAILIFDHLRLSPAFAVSNSAGWLIVFIGAVLLLPMPTLFEIPLAYTLLVGGAPLGMIMAVLFAGPAINLPSLLVVAGAAGIRISLLLAVLTGGLAIAAAFAFSG